MTNSAKFDHTREHITDANLSLRLKIWHFWTYITQSNSCRSTIADCGNLHIKNRSIRTKQLGSQEEKEEVVGEVFDHSFGNGIHKKFYRQKQTTEGSCRPKYNLEKYVAESCKQDAKSFWNSINLTLESRSGIEVLQLEGNRVARTDKDKVETLTTAPVGFRATFVLVGGGVTTQGPRRAPGGLRSTQGTQAS